MNRNAQEFNLNSLAEKHLTSAERFINCYRLLEIAPTDDASTEHKFLHRVGKLIERLQGTRHLLRHITLSRKNGYRLFIPQPAWRCNVDDTAPPPFSHQHLEPPFLHFDRGMRSERIIKGMAYNLGALSGLEDLAKNDRQNALAREVKKGVVLTICELIARGPALINLSQVSPNQELDALMRVFLMKRKDGDVQQIADEIYAAVKREQDELWRRFRANSEDGTRPRIFSKSQLMRALLHYASGSASPEKDESLLDFLGDLIHSKTIPFHLRPKRVSEMMPYK
jgi:hypothetical protein